MQRLRLLLSSTSASPPPPPRAAAASQGVSLATHLQSSLCVDDAAASEAAAAVLKLAQAQNALAAKTAEAEALTEELRMIKQQQQQKQQQHTPDSRPMSSVGVIQALNMQVNESHATAICQLR
jgi:hypothetical protein